MLHQLCDMLTWLYIHIFVEIRYNSMYNIIKKHVSNCNIDNFNFLRKWNSLKTIVWFPWKITVCLSWIFGLTKNVNSVKKFKKRTQNEFLIKSNCIFKDTDKNTMSYHFHWCSSLCRFKHLRDSLYCALNKKNNID